MANKNLIVPTLHFNAPVTLLPLPPADQMFSAPHFKKLREWGVVWGTPGGMLQDIGQVMQEQEALVKIHYPRRFLCDYLIVVVPQAVGANKATKTQLMKPLRQSYKKMDEKQPGNQAHLDYWHGDLRLFDLDDKFKQYNKIVGFSRNIFVDQDKNGDNRKCWPNPCIAGPVETLARQDKLILRYQAPNSTLTHAIVPFEMVPSNFLALLAEHGKAGVEYIQNERPDLQGEDAGKGFLHWLGFHGWMGQAGFGNHLHDERFLIEFHASIAQGRWARKHPASSQPSAPAASTPGQQQAPAQGMSTPHAPAPTTPGCFSPAPTTPGPGGQQTPAATEEQVDFLMQMAANRMSVLNLDAQTAARRQTSIEEEQQHANRILDVFSPKKNHFGNNRNGTGSPPNGFVSRAAAAGSMPFGSPLQGAGPPRATVTPGFGGGNPGFVSPTPVPPAGFGHTSSAASGQGLFGGGTPSGVQQQQQGFGNGFGSAFGNNQQQQQQAGFGANAFGTGGFQANNNQQQQAGFGPNAFGSGGFRAHNNQQQQPGWK